MSNIIELKNVNKWFDKFQVLKDINLEVKPKEKIVVCGPSGSGKSTLIRCINRLEEHQEGSIVVDGNEISENTKNIESIRAEVGMVFQQFNLFPHLTAIENVEQPQILIKKRTKPEAKEKAEELFNLVGLNDKKDHYPHELSGGQQQRVAIARALAMEPKIMLFDEVTSALDPELVDEVLTVLRKLASDTDTTMLTVTHEMNFAREFADRVLFFDGGQIVESGKPENIFSNPAEKRTKEFLKKFINNVN